MTHVFDASGLMSLIWPLVLCAAAWVVVIWALRQRDPVSEAVNGLLSPRRSTVEAGRLGADREGKSVDRSCPSR